MLTREELEYEMDEDTELYAVPGDVIANRFAFLNVSFAFHILPHSLVHGSLGVGGALARDA